MKLFNKKICLTMALFPVAFIAVGMLLIGIGIKTRREYKATKEVTATVVESKFDSWYDVDTERHYRGYDIYVDYTYEGEEYSNIYYATKSSSIDVGEAVTVRIHPDNPGKVFTPTPSTILYIGIPFVAVGLFFLFILLPMSISDAGIFDAGRDAGFIMKKRYLFVLIPIALAIGFGIAGGKIDPLFHIGTIISIYFTIVLLEMLG